MPSHWLLQQYGSWTQTQACTAGSAQPGEPCTTQHSALEHAPQSTAQSAHVSVAESQLPSPQIGQAPQSPGQLAQSSIVASQIPSPQCAVHAPQPSDATSPTQMLSHWLLQQYGSWAQTQPSTVGSVQPAVVCTTQHSSFGHTPQSTPQSAQVSVAGSQIPSPHIGHAPQSPGQLAQSSVVLSQIPSPQCATQVPQARDATSPTQMLSHWLSQQYGSTAQTQVATPRSVQPAVACTTQHSSLGQAPQSVAQSAQVSVAGSQIPSPHIGQAPQSPGQLAQSSVALSQIPLPQCSVHVPHPIDATSPTQMLSHWLLQQYGSWAQTQSSTAGSVQPVVACTTQHSSFGQAPQSIAQSVQVSVAGSQIPSPHTGQAPQSPGQLVQSSAVPSQIPSPQCAAQVPQPIDATSPTQMLSHWLLQQYGSTAQTQACTAGSAQPGAACTTQHSSLEHAPQSIAQSAQFSVAGSQLPSPHIGQAPQSPGQLAQSSVVPSQIPSPQCAAQVPQPNDSTSDTHRLSQWLLQQYGSWAQTQLSTVGSMQPGPA
jgi:hypothetical protein